MWLIWLILIIGGYLLGSIPSAYILVKATKGIDIRKVGSGNVGSTNTVRTAGRGIGAIVFLMDAAKGVIPTLLGCLLLGQQAGMCAGAAAFLGHIFPLWLSFRGGKGVATAFGAAMVIAPVPALICIAAWLIIAVISGYVSLGSCCAALLMFLITLFTEPGWFSALFFAFISLGVILRHRSNIIKIKNGTEGKSFRRKK